MKIPKSTVKNLCLHKSNDALYALKWDYECYNDEKIVEFEIECTDEKEKKSIWRLYGRTTLLCFPILMHRLNYGSIYKFRVFITRNNLIIGEKHVCDTHLIANEMLGEEFTVRKQEESIIRSISVHSFQDTQTTEDKDNDYYLKSFDSAFNDCDYKLWIPFKSSINPFYSKNNEYTKWTHQQKLVAKHDNDYKDLKRMNVELLIAFTHPKFDENHYNLVVHMSQLLYIMDDLFDSNTQVGHSVSQTRLLLSEFYFSMLGISDHITDSTKKNVAVKNALKYFTREYQKVADKHDMSLELMFDHLYNSYNFYVIESNTRHRFSLNECDFQANSMPELNHYFSFRNYTGGAAHALNSNALLLNYKIPFEVKKHPHFIKACVTASLELCVSNDILGVMKDAKYYETQSNIVLILEKYGQMSRKEALEKSCQIHDSIVRQYLDSKYDLLELFKNRSFTDDLIRYIEGMEDWMSGHIEWMKITQRFTHALTTHNQL